MTSIGYSAVVILLLVSGAYGQPPVGRRAGLGTVLQLSYSGMVYWCGREDLNLHREEDEDDKDAEEEGDLLHWVRSLHDRSLVWATSGHPDLVDSHALNFLRLRAGSLHGHSNT